MIIHNLEHNLEKYMAFPWKRNQQQKSVQKAVSKLQSMHTCNHLWLSTLTFDCSHCVGVSRKGVDICLGPDVPNLPHTGNIHYYFCTTVSWTVISTHTHKKVSYSCCGISTAGHQYVNCGMEVKIVDCTQMTMIVPYNLWTTQNSKCIYIF